MTLVLSHFTLCESQTSIQAPVLLKHRLETCQGRSAASASNLYRRHNTWSSALMSKQNEEHPSGPPTTGTRQPHHRKRAHKQDTHFLCFPLVNEVAIPQLVTSLAHFSSVTSLSSGDGQEDATSSDEASTFDVSGTQQQQQQQQKIKIVPSKAIRPPGTYHLTLGVMDLSQQERMDKAVALLQSIDVESLLRSDTIPTITTVDSQVKTAKNPKSSASDATQQTVEVASTNLESLSRSISPPPRTSESIHTYTSTSTATATATAIPKSKEVTSSPKLPPITISLTGLSTFPAARSARVLYAKPHDPSTRLHHLAVSVRQKFREAGLITESRPLVLHATVANLRYAVQAGRDGQKRDRWKQDGQTDAREIVRLFDERNGVGGEESNDASFEKREFVWAEGVVVDHLAICKLGAIQSDDPVLGLEYPPIAARAL